MLKFFRKYNKWIIGVGGSLLMIVFLIQPVMSMFTANPDNFVLGKFEGGEITVSIEDEKHTETIPPDAMGTDVLELYLTMTDVQEKALAQFQLKTDAGVIEAPTALPPARKWELYLLHHTHLDIGYTHHQDEVERIQWESLEQALRLDIDPRNPQGSLWDYICRLAEFVSLVEQLRSEVLQ